MNEKKCILAAKLTGTNWLDIMNRVYSPDGICPTLHTFGGGHREIKILITTTDGTQISNTVRGGGRGSLDRHSWDLTMDEKMRIRKLTPRECWRLMDFTDAQFNKAAAVNSDTQLYKQAGNSIVVACLVGIFKNLLKNEERA